MAPTSASMQVLSGIQNPLEFFEAADLCDQGSATTSTSAELPRHARSARAESASSASPRQPQPAPMRPAPGSVKPKARRPWPQPQAGPSAIRPDRRRCSAHLHAPRSEPGAEKIGWLGDERHDVPPRGRSSDCAHQRELGHRPIVISHRATTSNLRHDASARATRTTPLPRLPERHGKGLVKRAVADHDPVLDVQKSKPSTVLRPP